MWPPLSLGILPVKPKDSSPSVTSLWVGDSPTLSGEEVRFPSTIYQICDIDYHTHICTSRQFVTHRRRDMKQDLENTPKLALGWHWPSINKMFRKIHKSSNFDFHSNYKPSPNSRHLSPSLQLFHRNNLKIHNLASESDLGPKFFVIIKTKYFWPGFGKKKMHLYLFVCIIQGQNKPKVNRVR